MTDWIPVSERLPDSGLLVLGLDMRTTVSVEQSFRQKFKGRDVNQ